MELLGVCLQLVVDWIENNFHYINQIFLLRRDWYKCIT